MVGGTRTNIHAKLFTTTVYKINTAELLCSIYKYFTCLEKNSEKIKIIKISPSQCRFHVNKYLTEKKTQYSNFIIMSPFTHWNLISSNSSKKFHHCNHTAYILIERVPLIFTNINEVKHNFIDTQHSFAKQLRYNIENSSMIWNWSNYTLSSTSDYECCWKSQSVDKKFCMH